MSLQCGICLHVRWLAVEAEKLPIPEIRDAATLVNGNAVCALHIEDLDRAQGQWMLRIAGNILGVPLRRERPGR